MALSRRALKVLSIVQLIMAAIFFLLGMLDHFEVRFVLTSFTLMPCWIAVLVLPVGIIGLVLVNKPRPSSTLNYALRSVSIGCAAISLLTAEHYVWAINDMMSYKYRTAQNSEENGFPYHVKKGTKIKFTDEENTMIAIHALILIFSITEIVLAVASARGGDTGNQSHQENKVDNNYRQLEASESLSAQPMVAIPV